MSKITLKFGNGDGILSKEAEFTEKELKDATKQICKPCWELKYCPYGPLVENYPLPNIPRKEAVEHNQYLKDCVKSKKLLNGDKLDKMRLKYFQESIKSFNPEDYPETENKTIEYMSCSEFGHLCPAFLLVNHLLKQKIIVLKAEIFQGIF